MRTSPLIGWSAVVSWMLMQATGLQLMFHFHPAPGANRIDVDHILSTFLLLHWVHIIAGILSAAFFLLFAFISSSSTALLRVSSALGAFLTGVIYYSGRIMTSASSSSDHLVTSYLLHTLALPFVIAVGLTIVGVLKFTRWAKSRNRSTIDGSV